MAKYQVEWKRSAVKELKKLPVERTEQIIKVVDRLAFNPYPQGVTKLAGAENSYRIRVGDYRVIYNVFSNVLVIEIIRVGHRKDIYRK